VDVRAEPGERTPLTLLLGALAALGLVRVAGRFIGLIALLGVVLACVGAFAVGILVLRIALLR
jgi:hypothetical protein